MKIFTFSLFLLVIILPACQPKQQPGLTPEETAEYLEKGKQIVQESFRALSGQLATAMNEGGVQNAVSYCNLRANPIMDSLSNLYNATISRVTLRPRNPENLTDINESEIMSDYLKVMSEGGTITPIVQANFVREVVFYAPITIISPLCLKCHGEPGVDIIQEDYDLIRSLYPQDNATGYSMNELRGMWKVEFDKF